ncbi:hypothetical protein DK389_21565 [Methylobacterium durans]|uniref:TnsA endonuclease N-terminal domain-containing protein n=1 Tax=Methylobacterium durans TaxID=2202825 RepID=A0A2U8WAI2_9HYPH|nr:hypothetical protein DK389_21565 [Methylobacterium durans]
MEADLITILCVDPAVEGFWAQPEVFRWRQGGRARRYVPDFLILTTAGARTYREVKPLRRLLKDASLGGRRVAIEAECERRGATFETWTEAEIRRSPRLENAREILCHAGPVWDEPALAALRRAIRTGIHPATAGELLRSAGLGPDAFGTLLGLVALDEVRIEIDQPLALRSRLVGRRTA